MTSEKRINWFYSEAGQLCFNLFLISLLVFFSYGVKSQDQEEWYLTVKGKVILNDIGIEGAKVVLLKNGSKTDQQLTKSSGKFTFTGLTLSPKDDEYIIKISKPGHVTIKHWVSTKVPAGFKEYPTYFPTVELFKMAEDLEKEKALMAILEKPISKFSYNPVKGDFEDDKAYFSTIQAKVERLFEILEADGREQYRLIAEYRLRKMEEQKMNKAKEEAEAKRKAKEEKYNSAIAKADKAFNEKKHDKAKRAYQLALEIHPDGKWPKQQLRKIDEILTELKAKEETIARAKEKEAKEEAITAAKEDVAELKAEQLKKEAETIRKLKEAEEARKAEVEKNKAIKAEREKEIVEALAERDRLKKEKREEMIQLRNETEQKAKNEQIKAEAQVKAESQSLIVAAHKKKVNAEVNKKVKAQKTERMVAMFAETEVSNKKVAHKSGNINETEKFIETYPSSFTAIPTEKDTVKAKTYHEFKKIVNTKNEVNLIHSNLKKEFADKRKDETALIVRQYDYKPRIIESTDEGIMKTIKSTIIKYPVKEDKYQKVSYAWGIAYYLKNGVEISEETYTEELGRY
ncbi:MAG: hypothetical protein ABII90_14940 [Bacteroidota bacterium]